MKKLIEALADAAQLKTDYQDFQEILSQVLEVDSNENGEPTRVALGVNGTGCYIEIDESDIYFVTNRDRLSLRQLGAAFSIAHDIKEQMFPDSLGTDEDFDLNSHDNDINYTDTPIAVNNNQSATVIFSPYLLAAQNLNAFRVVYVKSDKTISYPDNTNAGQVKNVIGITLESAVQGSPVKIATQGLITNSAWNFDPTLDQPLLLNANGLFSQRNPTTGIEKFIGEVIATDTIILYQFPRIA